MALFLHFEAERVTHSVEMTEPIEHMPLGALYGVHRAELLRFLIARTGDMAEAEDLIQDLWLKASRGSSGPMANGRAYLFRMAQNLVVDRVRERQRRMRRERLWIEGDGPLAGSIEEWVDPSRDAESALIDREELTRLLQAIEMVPDGARRVFDLHKLKGLSHAEVAARLGISQSGVEKHMAVAMKYLRRTLAG